MRPSMEERFWSKVDLKGPDDCWEWQASKLPDGYGSFGVRSRVVDKAHRVSWVLKNGPIPDGMSVCHRCDNPPCVNPDHLFLGTQQDNMKDMVSKGRHGLHVHPERAASGDRNGARVHREKMPRGVNNPMARVPACIVRDVVRRYREGGVTHQALADELTDAGYQTARQTVSQWISGLNRKEDAA